MFTLRKANDRGRFTNSWLDSHHSFSFGEYYDPQHMGVSVLRVLNDDKVTPGAGFPTHPHRNMEIVSYVLDGELAHKDSMGNGSVIRAGDVQRMSAGTGITHSEFNPSSSDGTHFLQIWLQPNQQQLAPSYAQQYFAPEQREGQLKLLVSPDGRDGSIQANSDAFMYGVLLNNSQQVSHPLDDRRILYIHVAKGQAKINGHLLNTGDGATIKKEKTLTLEGIEDADVIVIDLPLSA